MHVWVWYPCKKCIVKSSNLLFSLSFYHIVLLFWEPGRVPRGKLSKSHILKKCNVKSFCEYKFVPSSLLIFSDSSLIFFFFPFWRAMFSLYPCCGAAFSFQPFMVKCWGGKIRWKENILPALKVSCFFFCFFFCCVCPMAFLSAASCAFAKIYKEQFYFRKSLWSYLLQIVI